MKKNLKIVSAAAAALLAVAPVVATGVNAVNATTINFNHNGSVHVNLPTVNSTTVNVTSNVNATAAYTTAHSSGSTTPATTVPSKVSGSINLSVNHKNVKAYFENSAVAEVYAVGIYPDGTANWASLPSTPMSRDGQGNFNLEVQPSDHAYTALLRNVYLRLPSDYVAKHGNTITIEVNDNGAVIDPATGGWHKSATYHVDPNGAVKINGLLTKPFKAADTLDQSKVSFYEKSNGNQVSTGSVDLNANSEKQLNVSDILNAVTDKYAAETITNQGTGSSTGVNNKLSVKTTRDDIAQQLENKGIKVASNGDFTVPDNGEFTVNFESSAAANGKTAKLAVTVNVPNVKQNHVDEYAHTTRVWNKKASYIYNDKHVRQGNSTMYAIGSGHNVVANADGTAKEYTIAGGVKAYKLSDGYFKGQYVDVRNFSTSRVHHVATNSNHKKATVRSRVFDVRGKAVKRMYINKGATVRVYGTKTIKGHKMYKIAKHNRYVKVANFR